MGNLEIAVQGSDDDVEVLYDLYDAFLDDDSLRQIRKDMIPAKPEAGEMGAAEIILLVMALNPGLLTALTKCVTTWFATRRSNLKLKIRGPKGQATLEFDGKNAVTEKHVLQAFALAEGIDLEAAE